MSPSARTYRLGRVPVKIPAYVNIGLMDAGPAAGDSDALDDPTALMVRGVYPEYSRLGRARWP